MIATRRTEFTELSVVPEPRYSAVFGSLPNQSAGSPERTHPIQFLRKPLAREGIYVTTVEYRRHDALHSMRLRTPVLMTSVRYAPDDDIWIATDDITREYGVGETWKDAIEDYVERLHSMAHWFKENRTPLGTSMEQRLGVYRRLFRDL